MSAENGSCPQTPADKASHAVRRRKIPRKGPSSQATQQDMAFKTRENLKGMRTPQFIMVGKTVERFADHSTVCQCVRWQLVEDVEQKIVSEHRQVAETCLSLIVVRQLLKEVTGHDMRYEGTRGSHLSF